MQARGYNPGWYEEKTSELTRNLTGRFAEN